MTTVIVGVLMVTQVALHLISPTTLTYFCSLITAISFGGCLGAVICRRRMS